MFQLNDQLIIVLVLCNKILAWDVLVSKCWKNKNKISKFLINNILGNLNNNNNNNNNNNKSRPILSNFERIYSLDGFPNNRPKTKNSVKKIQRNRKEFFLFLKKKASFVDAISCFFKGAT
jgi:hypothetical protein